MLSRVIDRTVHIDPDSVQSSWKVVQKKLYNSVRYSNPIASIAMTSMDCGNVANWPPQLWWQTKKNIGVMAKLGSTADLHKHKALL